MRTLIRAGRQDDRSREQIVVSGAEPEAAVLRRDLRDVDALADGSGEALGVALEVRNGLVAGQEAFGIVAAVGMTGELQEEVRRVQPEAVPAAGSPGLPDAPLLEHDVLAIVTAQVVAGCEARLPAPDDDRLDPVRHDGLCLDGHGLPSYHI